jgi:hypothetical protein
MILETSNLRIVDYVTGSYQLQPLQDWTKSIDPTGWWMSELYDGHRVVAEKGLVHSKQGKPTKPIATPKGFPKTPIEGVVMYELDVKTLTRVAKGLQTRAYCLYMICRVTII